MELLKSLLCLGSFWHGLKKKIVGDKVIDEKAAEHKEQFTALVRELKNVFRHDGLLLSLTVLPNVNSSGKLPFCLCYQNNEIKSST